MTDEWIKKIWYMHTMDYYSVIRGMRLGHLQRYGWTQNLSYRMKSEREKQTSYINAYMWTLENGTDKPIFKAGMQTQTYTMTCGHEGAGVG